MTPDTLLYRQVHPSFVQSGRPSSQAFRPTAKDNGKLSVYDGSMIDAESSWSHYTQILHLESVGTMGLTVNECNTIELPVNLEPTRFKEHAEIDFSATSSANEVRRKSEILASLARARGWMYQAAQ